jgi:hypothetical protein
MKITMRSSPFSSIKLIRVVIASLATGTMVALSGCSLIGPTLGMGLALAPLKLAFACIPEGTQIDTPDGSVSIETIRAGDVVVGYDGQPVRVQQIHSYLEDTKTDFYQVKFSNGGIVDLCSMHRIGGIRAKQLEVGSVISGGQVVTKIKIYQGVEYSYDLLTEDLGYRVEGIPVNSMIEEMYEAGRTGTIED